mmetsp:Transcript_36323/g.69687  ORF Transcript_36323/g.69687 Transcript_36323/m.69687 type:complete len:205 (+) Transcript_36323:3795-4409(+)
MLMLGAILKNEGKCKENIGHPPKNGTDRGVTLAENTCPLFAYSCLFLTRQDACDWIKMQLGYSDPTEPRHIQRNVDILRNKAHQSMSDGDVLSAHKSLFRRAVLLRHFSAARILTTSISSIAQVFCCLGFVNKMLQKLAMAAGMINLLPSTTGKYCAIDPYIYVSIHVYNVGVFLCFCAFSLNLFVNGNSKSRYQWCRGMLGYQ